MHWSQKNVLVGLMRKVITDVHHCCVCAMLYRFLQVKEACYSFAFFEEQDTKGMKSDPTVVAQALKVRAPVPSVSITNFECRSCLAPAFLELRLQFSGACSQ